jgi:hypothetical protein
LSEDLKGKRSLEDIRSRMDFVPNGSPRIRDLGCSLHTTYVSEGKITNICEDSTKFSAFI